MASAVDRYRLLKNEIAEVALKCNRDPQEIKLVAVSKNQTWDKVAPIYTEGCRDFGENRVQEALLKMAMAPLDCHWHFIGALQKNKVRKIVYSSPKLGSFALIHSVDSLELAKKISEVSEELCLNTALLIQVNTSGEQSKQGMSINECLHLFGHILRLPNIDVQGLMTMAPMVEDEIIIRSTFEKLRSLKERLLFEYQPARGLPHLSMGMSHDFKYAIQEGATLLRIGSKIWN